MKSAHEIIQSFIDQYNFKSYLEIGWGAGFTFEKIKCEKKISVDPDPQTRPTFHGTSDGFFTQNKDIFDLIFIDGLHLCEQVKRDIQNSLDCLSSDGIIVMHDCCPTTEIMQSVPRPQPSWTGDVWKAFLYYRQFPDLSMFTFNIDYGCGIIKKGAQEPLIIKTEDMTWDNFVKNKESWLNLKNT